MAEERRLDLAWMHSVRVRGIDVGRTSFADLSSLCGAREYHGREVLHLVGDEIEIEKVIFELQGSDCVDFHVCVRHCGHGIETRRSGVEKTLLGFPHVGASYGGFYRGLT